MLLVGGVGGGGGGGGGVLGGGGVKSGARCAKLSSKWVRNNAQQDLNKMVGMVKFWCSKR